MVSPLDRNHSWGRLEYFILECFSIRVTGVWMSVVYIDKSGGAAKTGILSNHSSILFLRASFCVIGHSGVLKNVFCCGFSCLWYITLYLVGSCQGWAAPGQCSCFPCCEVASQSSTYKRGCSCLKGMLRILECGVKSTIRFIPLSELSTYQICSVSPVHPMAASLTQGACLTCSAECDWQLLTAWITI